ncbi:MAG: hypothetical protein JKY69_07500, partial [Flavobacteriaceae bacterium]|nr:hypothetical protein [Flavobacteriaceae bacterium]
MEFESFYDGVLLHQGIKEGQTTPVNTLIGIIGKKGENIDKLLKEEAKQALKEEKPKEEQKEEKIEAKPDAASKVTAVTAASPPAPPPT